MKSEQERIRDLVSEAVALNTAIKLDESRLVDLKAKLVELPPGKYYAANGKPVTVVGPGTAIKPAGEQIAAARELAGEKAGSLFTRQVGYKPVSGFRDIVRALFTPARAEKIVALCEVPTAAQVRF